jgi:hypothetical protein
VNIGLIEHGPRYYRILIEQITTERVREHFRQICRGTVQRFELPNHALNFVLTQALDGGGTVSLRSDAQGKTYSGALLRMKVNVPGEEDR